MEGNQLGRTIGFPTANLQITEEDKLIPSDGVYVVSVALKSPSKQITLSKGGMMNIGIRPTVNGKSRVIEVHIFDFHETIYQQTIQVKLRHFLREEIKFNALEELKNQLSIDRQQAMSWLQQPTTL